MSFASTMSPGVTFTGSRSANTSPRSFGLPFGSSIPRNADSPPRNISPMPFWSTRSTTFCGNHGGRSVTGRFPMMTTS